MSPYSRTVMDPIKKTHNKNEYMKNYMRNYYKKINSETGKSNVERSYEYVDCDICGGKYMKSGKTCHLRTNKHKFGKFEQLNKSIMGT